MGGAVSDIGGALLNPGAALGISSLGGGGKGGKNGGPTPPDFTGAAEAQANSGHVNQSNPFGSTSWSQGADGRWNQNTQLSGGLQQGANNLMGQIGNQGPLGNGEQARDQAISGIYNQATSRLDPQFAQRETQERSMLANQGLDPGSEAYGNEMGNFNRSRNDAYSSAMNNAIAGGTAAQQATFGENLAAQQAPYQQLGMLNGQMSGLSGTGAQTQYLPAASQLYNGQLQNYGIQQSGKNSMLGGAAGLGTAALFASDESLKQDIDRLPVDALPGVPFAAWTWKSGGDGFGVIAQDVQKVRPDLVHRHPDGYLMVDYSFLGR